MEFHKHDQALVSPEAKIGDNTRIWAFTNVQAGASIGKNCNICDGCYVEKGVAIGDHVTIKNNVAVFEGITVEDDVFIGANVTFINDRYPRSHNDGQWHLEKTTLRKGATVGAGSTILCGLNIGEYAFIGAGSVITKNIAPYSIYFGNPAALRGYMCACGQKLDERFICSCGKKYRKEKEGLTPDE